jgi:hypothetical protein
MANRLNSVICERQVTDEEETEAVRKKMYASRAKSCMHTCSICGKLKPELSGWWYKPEFLKSLNANFVATEQNDRIYACNRCIDPLVKKKATAVRAEITAGIPSLSDQESKALRIVLEGLSGWVRITHLASSFNKAIGFNDVSPKRI